MGLYRIEMMKLFVFLLLLILLSCSESEGINESEIRDSTIVGKYGKLSVNGSNIVDKNGNDIALRGMSLFWSQWAPGRRRIDAQVEWAPGRCRHNRRPRLRLRAPPGPAGQRTCTRVIPLLGLQSEERENQGATRHRHPVPVPRGGDDDTMNQPSRAVWFTDGRWEAASLRPAGLVAPPAGNDRGSASSERFRARRWHAPDA